MNSASDAELLPAAFGLPNHHCSCNESAQLARVHRPLRGIHSAGQGFCSDNGSYTKRTPLFLRRRGQGGREDRGKSSWLETRLNTDLYL